MSLKKYLDKNIKKITETAVMIIIMAVFSLLFWEEYLDFHESKKLETVEKQEINKSLEVFDLKNISEFQDIELYSTPDKRLLEKIVDLINKSEKEVLLQSYIFTEKRILEAIKKAYNRWVEVKVVMERNPYLAYNINNSRFNELNKIWIPVSWSNPENYSLNHSKFLLIDWLSIVSTGNFSYSKFTKNKDFLVFIWDENFYEKMKKIFINDFEWNLDYTYLDKLVNSPYYSREKLNELINSAENEIKIYIQYFSDDQINELLIQKSKQWVEINVILPEKYFFDLENKHILEKLISNWINITYLDKYKQHSKAILVDNKYLFIWSINFSEYSIDKNKEVWIIIKNKTIIEKFNSVFTKDFKLFD